MPEGPEIRRAADQLAEALGSGPLTLAKHPFLRSLGPDVLDPTTTTTTAEAVQVGRR